MLFNGWPSFLPPMLAKGCSTVGYVLVISRLAWFWPCSSWLIVGYILAKFFVIDVGQSLFNVILANCCSTVGLVLLRTCWPSVSHMLNKF